MDNYLEKYARLIVELGVNIKKGHYFIIQAPIEAKELVNKLSELAFAKGARDVVVFYEDIDLVLKRLENCQIDEIREVKQHEADSLRYYLEKGAVSLLLNTEYPYLFKDIDPDVMKAYGNYQNDLRNNIRYYMNHHNISWCIASYPNARWAQVIYPNLNKEEALTELTKVMYDICLINQDDPIKNWHRHVLRLGKISSKLNDLQLDRLHFTSENGTDLVVGLPENHQWHGGKESVDYITFEPNIPTQEVFTSPDKFRVNGKVVASRPLALAGAIIEDFHFTFKDGKVVECKALKNEAVLKELISRDEGASYLGEVALVQYDSPISKSNLLFYNTLYDENAACHLALGNSFASSVKGCGSSNEEKASCNLNNSKIHIDFMFGCEDLSIVGYDKQGKEYQIFVAGNFVI